MTQLTIAERLRATVGEARLQPLLQAYAESRGAILPLAVLLRDEGVGIDDDVVTWIAQTCITSTAMVTSALSAFPELMNDPDSITVCDGLSCRLMGAGYVQRLLRDRLGSDRVCTSPCQNACSSAPIVQVRGALYGGLQEASLKALAQRLEQPERAS